MPFDNGPGLTSFYGFAVYGSDVYGEWADDVPATTTGIYVVQDGYCPRYLRFQFSGATLPLYVFEVNPSEYNPYPQRTTQQYQTVLNFNPTVDENYNKIEMSMAWQRMPESMWEAIYPYTRKKVDGTSEDLYLWDGEIGHFRETRIKVENFKGEVKGGYDPVDRFTVSMAFRIA